MDTTDPVKMTGQTTEKDASTSDKHDVESTSSVRDAQAEEVGGWRGTLHKLAAFGRVEVRGIAPIPVAERTVTRTINVFTLWWCMNANMLP